MLATFVAPPVAFAIAALASILVAFLAPKGKAGMAAVGSMIGFIGIIGIATGTILQRWRGGPPLEGPLAKFGSLLMLGFGLYILFLAFSHKSDDHSQRR